MRDSFVLILLEGVRQCDTTCRVLVGLMTTFLLALLPAALLLYWRKRSAGSSSVAWWMPCLRKRRRGRYEERHLGSSSHHNHSALVNQLHNGLSVYIDAVGRDELLIQQSSSSLPSLPFGISVSNTKGKWCPTWGIKSGPAFIHHR